jgi:hypothetical protein
MRRLYLGLLCVVTVGAPASVFLACSGSSTSPGAAPDGGGDGTIVDGNHADVGTGMDTSMGDTSVPPMDAGTDAAVGCAANGATRKACLTCCDTEYADAALAYAASENSCACAADLCGANGSEPDASDGAYGTGACTALCGGDGGTADTACNTCRAATLKAAADGGEAGACRSTVTACESNTECAAWLMCEGTCPKAGSGDGGGD